MFKKLLVLCVVILSLAAVIVVWRSKHSESPSKPHFLQASAGEVYKGAGRPLPRTSARAPGRGSIRTEEAALTGSNQNLPLAVTQFSNWSEEFLAATTPEGKGDLVAKGELLARERLLALSELIQTNPKLALESAVPMRVRQQLPETITQHLEERVSGRGFYGALISDNFEEGRREIRREVVLNNRSYQAFVYGRRATQTTKANVPMHGVAVGTLLALHEDPVRPLEAGEVDPRSSGKEICPVSSRPATLYGTEALADVGGRIEHFCGALHINKLNERLAADSGDVNSDAAGEPPIAKDSWSQGPKTLLFMRVAFPDDPSEPITEDGAYALMDAVNQWFVENSYDSTSIIPTVTPLLMLPQTKAWYGIQGTGRLLSDSREAARDQAGLDTDNFSWDIVRHGSVPGSAFSYGGLGYVHGKGVWLQSSGTGVACHELGHNYGLWHANSWTPYNDGVTGLGTHVEYGNSFDTMGAANAGSYQYNVAFKNQLDWLADSFVHYVKSNGTYRIYTYDLPNLTPGQKYALRIKKDYDRNYWAEFRQKFSTTSPQNRWFNNGVLLNWDPWDNGVTNSAGGTHLLDTTPGTPDGKNDCPVVIGRTFSDFSAGVHITPIGKGDTSPENWIDVAVNLGTFPTNHAPVASISADRTSVALNGNVSFIANASDDDDDTLAYAWDFGDATFGANSPAVIKSWSVTGEYNVRCTVSDMKGGTFSQQIVITVGSPTTFRISGRIITQSGAPLEGVRVHNGLTGTTYRGTYTDSDGNYILANNVAGSHTIAAVKSGYTLGRVGWSNPVTVGPNASGLNWTAVADPVVSVAVTDAIASETGPNPGTFTIARVGATNTPLVVKLNRTGTATYSSDYTMSPAPSGSPLQITIPTGAASVNVIVTPVNDTLSEGPETVTLTLIDDITYLLGPLAEATLTIADDEAASKPTVDVSASTPAASADNLAPESGSDSGVFTFTRTGSTAGELTVFYSIGGTATPGVDYSALSGVVTIPVGETVTTVPFTTVDDTEVEPNETVVVTILSNAAYNGAGDTTTITIVDDDPTLVTITPTDDVAREAGASTGSFTVSRVGSLAANLAVNYTMSGTAINGVDYTALSGSVTIPFGKTSAAITVTPVDDALVEGEETVVATLTSSPAYNIGIPGVATVTLIDNEIPSVTLTVTDATAAEPGTDTGTFTFTRTGSTVLPLTVHFNVNGTAINGVDYVAIGNSVDIPAGSATATLTVTPLNDSIPEVDERVILVLEPDPTYVLGTTAPQTVTIRDNDGGLPGVGFTFAASSGVESKTSVQLSVSLSTNSSSSVSVNYTVTGGTATGGGVDYTLGSGTLTFAPGTNNQSINLTVNNDTLVEANETIVVTLSNPGNAQLDAQVTHTYTILDDDAFGSVTISAIDPTASETGPDLGTFRISRTSGTASNLTVFFQVLGSASAPSDYLPIGESAIIPAGVNFVDIFIIPVDDDTDETDETVIVNLTSAPGAKIGTPDIATVTILDNDSSANLPIVSIVATDPSASEPGSDTGMFTITRDRNTNDALIVNYTITGSAINGTDYNSLSNSVTIPAGETQATVTVIPRDDALFETNETVVITLTLQGTYRVAPDAASATVTIVDDEIGVAITSAGASAEDGSSTGMFILTRTGSIESNLTVNFSVSGTATSGSDYTALGASVVIPAGTNSANLPVLAINDALPEGNEWVVVTLSSGTGYKVIAPTNAIVVIIDDEPGVSIVATDSAAAEPANPGAFSITRSGNTDAPLTVNFTVSGTASNGVDYAFISNSIAIPAGQVAAAILVSPIDDATIENDETVQITLATNPAYAILAPSSAFVTISDDEVNLVPVVSITSPTVDTVYLLNTNLAVTLEATARDDGQPNPVLTTTWSRVSGPGTVTFGTPGNTNTTARFSANGTYVLRLTANDGVLLGTDDLTVTVGPEVGLQAYWRFDESTGLALDASGNNRNATVNGPLRTASGRFDRALDFDGVDDFASFNSPALTQFTITAWIRSDTTGDSTTPRVIAMPGYDIRVRRDPASTINALALESIRSTTAGEWRTPGDVVLDGNWYYIAVVYDSSSTANVPQFYINGVNQATTTRTAPVGTQVANTGTGYIGNQAALDRSWDGIIDEMHIYNRLLSSNEIQTLFTGPITNYAPVVDAGPNLTVSVADAVRMNGVVTDDGKPNPPGAPLKLWSKISGPGIVQFANDQSETTMATFSATGSYVLRLSADDTQVKVFDEVTISVLNATVIVQATDDTATELGPTPGAFTITRTVPTNGPLTVHLALSGTASNGVDFNPLLDQVTIAAGAFSARLTVNPVADNIAEGAETVVLTLQPDPAAYVVGGLNSATVTIEDRPWDAWRFDNFTSTELGNPAISGEQADSDHDGLWNLLEYAYNLQPKSFDATRGFSGAIESIPTPDLRGFVVTFRQRIAPSDLTYQVQVTTDLVNWNTGPTYLQQLSVVDDGNGVTETVKWQVMGSLTQPGTRFARLVVTRQ